MTVPTEILVLQKRRSHLLQEIVKAADEISEIDANLKLVEAAIHA